KRRDDDAREYQSFGCRSRTSTRETVNRERGYVCPCEREERSCPFHCAKEHEGDHRPHCGAVRDAKQVRLSKRVSQQRLVNRTRSCQRSADCRSQKDSRQTNLEQNVELILCETARARAERCER